MSIETSLHAQLVRGAVIATKAHPKGNLKVTSEPRLVPGGFVVDVAQTSPAWPNGPLFAWSEPVENIVPQ